MSWRELHELDTRNGRMRLVKLFGSERLLAEDGIQQSGAYMNGVWKRAFREFPTSFLPKHVVFLGVGTGGALHIATKRFPTAQIIGIEWDKTLCEIARERLKNEQNISIKETSAEEWIKSMNYADLICVDLFTGANVAPCVRDINFLRFIVTHAQTTCINVYTHTDILENVDNAVAGLPRKRLQYYASTIGLYGSPDVRR